MFKANVYTYGSSFISGLLPLEPESLAFKVSQLLLASTKIGFHAPFTVQYQLGFRPKQTGTFPSQLMKGCV